MSFCLRDACMCSLAHTHPCLRGLAQAPSLWQMRSPCLSRAPTQYADYGLATPFVPQALIKAFFNLRRRACSAGRALRVWMWKAPCQTATSFPRNSATARAHARLPRSRSESLSWMACHSRSPHALLLAPPPDGTHSTGGRPLPAARSAPRPTLRSCRAPWTARLSSSSTPRVSATHTGRLLGVRGALLLPAAISRSSSPAPVTHTRPHPRSKLHPLAS